ncbi:carbohydrate-binding protein [Rhodoligotrophos defluvii]|uniref:carbohydrate-binding protein n=1 Tax=Rhodoligotrophos defluvii TaxID=2561934 RepID=UPI0010C981D9|nr:carbohydrate-binding protein [Rhodoligotrophos defluvii]
MAQPTPYNRQYQFQSFQRLNPNTPLPADKVDGEFNAVKRTIDETLANLKLIQRDDGALVNASVGRDQLKADISIGFDAPTAWATGVSYTTSSTVYYAGSFYRCIVAHVSGADFVADLTDGRWELIANFSQFVLNDVPATLTSLTFDGDGVQTTFDLTFAPAAAENVIAIVNGQIQPVGAYSINGTQIIFDVAPSAGTDNVEVRTIALVSELNATSANLVSYSNSVSGLSSTTVQAAIDEIYQVLQGDEENPLQEQINALSTRVTTAEGDITALEIGKSPIGHTHVPGDVIGLGDMAQQNASSLPALTAAATSAWKIPVGTTGQRPSPAQRGMIRFNTSSNEFEGYNGSSWVNLKGAI